MQRSFHCKKIAHPNGRIQHRTCTCTCGTGKRKVGEAHRALFQFSALLSARVRERRPAFCFCQKAALWCGCADFALSRGKADLRRTAKTALQNCSSRETRPLSVCALGLESLRRPSRSPAVEIPIHLVESDVSAGTVFWARTPLFERGKK